MDKYIVAGIDEAGRGPVIGPMVIACVAMERDSLSELVEMGLRDSKTLSKTKREFLVHRIGSIAKAILVEVVEPREIDSAVERRKYRSLNDLESNIVARLITRVKIPVKVFYVDSPDIKPARYARRIRNHLKRLGYKSRVEIICENNADRKYAVVSAASVIAKVIRDTEVEKLSRIYGDIGSGYPSDPKTIGFLKKVLKSGVIPPFVRRSWRTVDNILRDLRIRE